MTIDTQNTWGIGLQGTKIVILLPPKNILDCDEALTIAAWIVSLADPNGKRFAEILKEVQQS